MPAHAEEMNPIARAIIDSRLGYSLADGLHVAEQPRLQTNNALSDPLRRARIRDATEPLRKKLCLANRKHVYSGRYRRLPVNYGIQSGLACRPALHHSFATLRQRFKVGLRRYLGSLYVLIAALSNRIGKMSPE